MEFRQLKYFVAIVDAGSLTRASEHLHVAQPALTQQIANLEGELGVKLLTRSARGVSPTEAGGAFYRHAQSILRSCQDAAAATREAADTLTGTVSVGLPSSVGAVVAVELIKVARERFPSLRLQVTDSSSVHLKEMLLQGRLDLAVLFDEEPVRGLECVSIADERLLFVTRGEGQPARLPLPSVALSQVADQELLLPIAPNQLRLRVEEAFMQIGRQPKLIAEVSSMSALAHAVASGLASTITSWSVVAPELARGAVRAFQIEQPEIMRSICLWQSDAASSRPVTRAVGSLLTELLLGLGEQAGWRARARREAAG